MVRAAGFVLEVEERGDGLMCVLLISLV